MEITIQISKADDWDNIIYSGPINEDTEVHLAPLLQNLSSKIIFNFRKVEYVNSCGVRAWINFLREAEKDRTVIFDECTPEIVSQINMIPNFRSSAHIRSVYASYVCESCEHQHWQLFTEGQNLPKTPEDEIDAPKCEKCGSEMEMEELEDEFFAFLEAS
jgi:anti-anti-sigma regulatory factor